MQDFVLLGIGEFLVILLVSCVLIQVLVRQCLEGVGDKVFRGFQVRDFVFVGGIFQIVLFKVFLGQEVGGGWSEVCQRFMFKGCFRRRDYFWQFWDGRGFVQYSCCCLRRWLFQFYTGQQLLCCFFVLSSLFIYWSLNFFIGGFR